jgi:4-aminobutyrate aminotransferase-like enzyme
MVSTGRHICLEWPVRDGSVPPAIRHEDTKTRKHIYHFKRHADDPKTIAAVVVEPVLGEGGFAVNELIRGDAS